MAYSRTWKQSFNQLNWLSVVGLIAFTLFSLTLLGVTGDVVSLLETYPWLPLTGSLGAMVLIFLASGTRDPSMYHQAELVLVLVAVAVMAANAYVTEVQNVVATHEPVSLVVLFLLFLGASAVLSR